MSVSPLAIPESSVTSTRLDGNTRRAIDILAAARGMKRAEYMRELLTRAVQDELRSQRIFLQTH